MRDYDDRKEDEKSPFVKASEIFLPYHKAVKPCLQIHPLLRDVFLHQRALRTLTPTAEKDLLIFRR